MHLLARFQSLAKNKVVRFTLRSIGAVFLLFLLLNLVFPLQIRVPYSPVVYAKDGSVLHAFLSHDDKWRMKTELPEITGELRKIIVYKEDKYFYYHFGINPVAVIRAAVSNMWRSKTTSGASTITMQVARLLAPKERTYANKLVEMFRALQLEWQFSKEEILQLYLNLVPYGGNVEGVKSASVLYFGRLPEQLSLAQVVTLAIVPNRPTSLHLGKNNPLLTQERNKWLRRLLTDKQFTATDIRDARNEPLQTKRTNPPTFAPHLAYRLKATYPDSARMVTTVDRSVQWQVQQLTYNYHRRLKRFRIHNAAVLVVDNKTREVIAYVGSPDFSDERNAGQVDGVRAVRSPGSTLKPLAYALGIDAGKLTPKTVLTDVPTAFAGYQPENFDRTYHGNVTAEKALAFSLNIPAVKVLAQTGVPVLIEKLKQAGFTQIRKDENKLGLSVILGGCGVTLEELTGLFAAFANEGTFAPLKLIAPSQPSSKGKGFFNSLPMGEGQGGAFSADRGWEGALISPSAAFMLHEILTQATRPDLPNHYQSNYHIPKIAWKTGTSYGRRDAWSMGYNARYTVGVWVGNASGEGIRELTGADIATPLLFNIFNTIDYNSTERWFAAPRQMGFRLVCAESGLVPSEHCPHQIADYFIPLVSTAQPCTHLKEVAVAADESFSYCTSCLPESGYKKKQYPNLPPDLMAFYESSGVAYVKIPPHNPACTRILEEGAPVIVSPANGREYFIDASDPPELLLSCQTDNEVKRVYWYINDQFYQAADATEKVFIIPVTGSMKISCSDDKGRNTDVRISVFPQ